MFHLSFRSSHCYLLHCHQRDTRFNTRVSLLLIVLPRTFLVLLLFLILFLFVAKLRRRRYKVRGTKAGFLRTLCLLFLSCFTEAPLVVVRSFNFPGTASYSSSSPSPSLILSFTDWNTYRSPCKSSNFGHYNISQFHLKTHISQ